MELNKLDLDAPEIDGVEIAHGLAPVLNTITDLVNARTKPKWSLFLVSFETMLRNRMSERDYTTDIVDGAINDARILCRYLIALAEACQNTIRPTIALYTPHYTNISRRYLRDPLPAHTADRWHLVDDLEQKLPTVWDIKDDNVSILLVSQDKNNRDWLSKALVTDIDSSGGHPVRYCETLMLSHMPADYHLMRRVPRWNLIESYTGAIKNPAELGKKIFGSPNIPFNKYTHLLFGDKYLLKAIAAPGNRKEMKRRAAIEHWELLPEQAILKIIQQMRFIPTELITAPNV